MSNRSLAARVQEDLAQAVASGLLPASVQERAEKLLERLKTPVRVSLLGLPGSGKSTVLNLLLGAIAVPVNVPFPTLQLTYGDPAQSICTLPNGTKETVPHANGKTIADLSPAFVEMQMPLPALGKISLLEVVTPDDPLALDRSSQWAAKRSDVAIWCTGNFNEVEQSLWARMPDHLKDHSFLMVTRADVLIAMNELDATMDAIEEVARDEFTQILPIASKQAIAARRPNGTVDKALMRSSGGSALISAVLKQVDMGRQTAVDLADILLHQHADELKPLKDAPAEPVVAAAPPKPATTSAPEQPKPRVAAPLSDPRVAPEVVATAPKSTAPALQPATREAYENAVSYILTNSQEMADLVTDGDDDVPRKIIAKAVEQVQWLSDYLMENGDDMDDLLQQTRDAAMDAADLVQLMQMEKRDSAAIEAVSLLLQLKHELQADLVA